MLVKIPMFPRAEDAKPLERCIEYASKKTGVDHYTAVLFMTHFLDQLADEVAKGHPVSVPGFGLFAAVFERRGKRPGTAGDRVLPKFSPSQGFRNQVAFSCPPDRAPTARFIGHRDHGRFTQGRTEASRVFTAMENIRASIRRQLGNARDEP